ncbi:MAG: GNAT family N-acetyltransferase [Sulfitobacter sp.]
MVEIAYARPEEREDVAQFMVKVFPRAKWDITGWRKLLAGRWNGPDGRYAIIVRDKGEIVGCLGLVIADRLTSQGPKTIADMSSWYVLKEYRAQGVGRDMIALALSDPKVTIVNFASAKAAVNVLVNAGLTVLDEDRFVWRPTGNAAPFLVHDQPLDLGDRLIAKDRKVLEDHQGLRLRPVAVETPDGLCVVVMYPQKKHDEYVTLESMYVGDQGLFARHARGIADSILSASGEILTLDRRLGANGIESDGIEPLGVPRFYREGLIEKADIDMLYSECILLNVKIH